MKFKVPIYGVTILFFTDFNRYNALYKKHVGNDDSECLGVVFRIKYDEYALGVFDGSLQTLVHECGHLAVDIMRSKNIGLASDDGEEAFCYLLDHLYWQLNKHVERFA